MQTNTLIKINDDIKKEKIIYLILKKIIDILAGILGTILLIPLTIIVFIIKKINKEKGSIFYTQLRIGKNGKIIKIYKFRSMVEGAEEKLKEYLDKNPEDAEHYKKYKKLINDPRITKTGKFLRDTSIDEWPQFLNLFTNMSLFGPRPYLLSEKEDMGDYYNYIIRVKPRINRPLAS